MKTEFVKYDIVKYLESKNSIYYGRIIELYNLCESMLSEIPSVFPNYTLHDIGHSVRVIGYMNDLIKGRLEDFSELHIALIIFVGLLHDIGMVVSNQEKEILYSNFEKTNLKFQNLSSEEKLSYLSDFIRKNHGKRVFAALNYEVNNNINIKSFLYAGCSLSYDLSEIVAKICQSHTESTEWIIQNISSSYEYADDIINPQHIAFLLRIGDALDIDDRRAPYILYKILNPKGISDKEWKKHIPITNYNKVKNIDNCIEISFSGICKEPEIFRKIMEYLDWLDNDLKQITVASADFQSQYQLKIKLPINRDIETQGFINTLLSFKLEYNQIIKLLMGEKIYGNKREGLRELIQNSIDAVCLMRDIQANGNEYGYTTYHPEIRLILSKTENRFVIVDNGTGMTEEILDKYFFNVGTSYYTSAEFDETNYEYQPIGHFGIGFLACFMLSSKIELETKHFKNKEHIHLTFDKDSPYITKLNTENNESHFEHGTKIIMEYNQIIPNIFDNENSVITYIKKLLRIENYDFLFVNQDTRDVEKIDTLKLEKIKNKDDEQIEFTYNLGNNSNVRFNFFDFFPDNENVYIVNPLDIICYPNYVSLSFFKETLDILEAKIQTDERNLWQIANDDDTIYDLAISDFVIDIMNYTILETSKKDINKNNFRSHLEGYIYKFIKENMLEWYDIPVIFNRDTFNKFIDCVKDKGIVEALKIYDSSVRMVSVISKEELTDKLLIDIVDNYIYLCGEGDNVTDVGYFEKYPIMPIKKKIDLYGFSDTNCYLRIVQSEKFDADFYLKGIRINDKMAIPHYTISGINLENVCLNIKKGQYDTDVSRNNFSAESKKRLINRMICFIYEDIINSNMLDKEEVKLVKLFLKDFYNFDTLS